MVKKKRSSTHKTHTESHVESGHHKKSSHHHDSSSQAPGVQVNALTVILGLIVVILLGYIIFSNMGSSQPVSPQLQSGDGRIIIEEFSDFTCPFCQRAQPTIEQLKQKYGDRLEVRFRHFPVRGDLAVAAAQASECARDQGAFDAYKTELFNRQATLSQESFQRIAQDLRLNTDTFMTCLTSGVKMSIVNADLAEGQQRGVGGTPTFFINGQELVGAQPLAEFERIIAQTPGVAPSGATPQVADPQIDITVIIDRTCTVCDDQMIIEVLTTEIFPNNTLTVIEHDTPQAEQLIEQHGIMALPAYFLSANVNQAAAFAELAQVLEPRGDLFLITPGVTGGVQFLVAPDPGNSPSMGSPDAPITIIEFTDYYCPFCGRHHDETLPRIIEHYVDTGLARYVVKEFLRVDTKAAESAHCVRDQLGDEGYFAMSSALFGNQQSLNDATFRRLAQQQGVDMSVFDSCMASGVHAATVNEDTQLARMFGVSGTPGFFIDNTPLNGALPFEAFQQVIDAKLE